MAIEEGFADMPRLVKGGKWTYGWALVGLGGEIVVPPEAWAAYGFHAGMEAVFLRGSRTSGGFAVGTPASIGVPGGKTAGVGKRELCRTRFGKGRVLAPLETGVKCGDRLLTVRGSRCGLGFVARGPIYLEALEHPELETFGEAQ
jgi:hypothetical protein